jgi:hypothetical protein
MQNNGTVDFADLHFDKLNSTGSNLPDILTFDVTPFTCSLPALPAVSF